VQVKEREEAAGEGEEAEYMAEERLVQVCVGGEMGA
jgi:hypothetical protein